MSIAAKELCDEHNVNFSSVFSQQFLISQKSTLSLPEFTQTRFSNWYLLTGSTLPLSQAALIVADLAYEIIVMGRAVDQAGGLVTTERLKSLLPKMASIDELGSYVTNLGGRYVALISDGNEQRLYLDPAGTMGVVVNQESSLIGSTLYMVMSNHTRPSLDNPELFVAGRHCFGTTPDRDIKALTPNFYYNMKKGTETRHWPVDNPFVCNSLTELDHGIDEVIARHSQIMSAISKIDEPTILPITGGEDSRVLLAIATASNCSIDKYFCHITTWKSQTDAKIAKTLAENVGVDIEILKCNDPENGLHRRKIHRQLLKRALAAGEANIDPARFKPKYMGNQFTAIGREIHAALRLPVGGHVFRGHVTDISKAVLWRQAGARNFRKKGGVNIPVSLGLHLLMLGDEAKHHPWYQQCYTEWLNGLPKAAKERQIDFMGLELYRTYTLGTLFYSLNRNFYLPPGNDRKIIGHLVSASPLLRYDFHYNDLILKKTRPDLLPVPYARENDNNLRGSRKSLMQNLKYYDLVR